MLTISPADVGTLIHESFDQLVTGFADDLPGYGEPWIGAHRRRLAEIADALVAEMAADGRTGHPRLWQQLVRVQADLQATLTARDLWRAEQQARVVASELALVTWDHAASACPES